MYTLHATNINDAWAQAVNMTTRTMVSEPSRAGPVKVFGQPVTTVYNMPWQRVLFDPKRDANPIFHLHEALWMLAGRDDATWLDQFVSDFSQRFAEPDGHMHGAYGARWRKHFRLASLGCDQLDEVVDLLKADPTTRQAVIQMWDCEVDLGVKGLKDRPCNTHIYLRIDRSYERLEMCVMCRSNDIVWGAYGANAVHFSILQEYLAARIGVKMGPLTQVSFNWHIYDAAQHLVDWWSADHWAQQPYPGHQPLVDDPERFDIEVRDYVNDPTVAIDDAVENVTWRNRLLTDTALPMYMANAERKAGNIISALSWANRITAPDWRMATVAWLERRRKG